jgi:tetratricopeptide (TPR) repeat protein
MATIPGWYSPAEDESPDWGPCPACGTANAATARFCQACGRQLVEPDPDPVVAEVLTAVVGELLPTSDAFALPADAEARLTAARDALAAAGGTLRELAGSPFTVAAVFGPAPPDGISTLTAVRAAATARDAVTGESVALRVGVGGSDVRSDDEHAAELWRGRVIDLALRLSRMATPGEVILGESAYRLIRDAVDVEPIDPRADPDGNDVGPLRVRAVLQPAGALDPGGAADDAPIDSTEWGEVGLGNASGEEPPWGDPWSDTYGWEAGTQPAAEQPSPWAEGDIDTREPGPWAEGEGDTQEPSPWAEGDGNTQEPSPWAEPDIAAGEPPAIEGEPDVIDGEADEPAAEASGREERDQGDVAAAPHEPIGAALLERHAPLLALHEALDRAIADSRPVIVTIGGVDGSGRTSLARWFAGETADRAWTIQIACRPAEAGGTAWPFAALVRAAIGLDGPTDRGDLGARLRAAIDDDRGDEHAGTLARYVGGDEGGTPPDETRAAIAALLSATVARRPLVVIVDDADGAPASARALFESVVSAVQGPLLIVSIGGDPADVAVQPLTDAAVGELVERLLARPNLPPDATAAIVRACGGIPLAVEHLVAMLADDGHLRWEYGRWTPTVDLASLPLPADLSSLIARRIGGLREEERRVAAVAAIAGGPFDAETVGDAIGVDGARVRETCVTLADRGILRRVDDHAFAFGHDVIAGPAAAYADRDAVRAMHAISADRLTTDRAPGPDIDEAIGAHLERAFRIAGADAGREASGRRAAVHLTRAARGAADVGDDDASLALLRRAAGVLPTRDPGRAQLLLDSATTLVARDERGPAERLLGDAVRAARASGDELLELRARVTRARMLAEASRVEDQIESLRHACETAIAAAAARADHPTAATAWSARGWVHVVRGNFAGAADAFERAATASAAAGRRRDEVSALRDLAGAVVDGPAPVDEAIERCRSMLQRARGTRAEAAVASALAVLLARRGRADEARETLASSSASAEEDVDVAAICRTALVELHAGSPDRAEQPLRSALQQDIPAAARGAVQALLAYVLTELGRVEAIGVADAAASLADGDDVMSQVTWRAAKARCLAVGGRQTEARALVRLALRLADQTDLSELRARTRLDLAEVLLASGRANEAGPAARSAVRALERKGSVAGARRAREILDRVAGRAASTAPVEAEDMARGDATALTQTSGNGESQDAMQVSSDSAPAGAVATDQDDSSESGKRDRHWFW